MADHKSQHPQPGQSQPAQPGHMVNGKHTAPGHKVHYTAPDGQRHNATIDKLDGPHADLTAHNGQRFTAVPHSATGGAHTWNHQD